MKKIILSLLLIICTFSIPYVYGATNYWNNSGKRNCSEYPYTSNNSGKKYVTINIQGNAPVNGNFNCTPVYTYSGMRGPLKSKGSNYNCGNGMYAGSIMYLGDNNKFYKVFCKKVHTPGNNDYFIDSFFPRFNQISYNNNNKTCPYNGFPERNKNNISKSGSFKCINFEQTNNCKENIVQFHDYGLTSCGYGAYVVSFDKNTKNMRCRRCKSTLSDSYTMPIENKLLHTYVYNYGGPQPILVEGNMEKENDYTSSDIIRSNNDLRPETKHVIEKYINMRQVSTDTNTADLQPGNYRKYTFQTTKICNESGEPCTTFLGTNDSKYIINYNIYAHNQISGIFTKVEGKNTFNNAISVADGEEKRLTFKLRDKYGNSIIPVYKAVKDGGIKIRDLEFSGNYDNSVYLDQYNQKNSGVEIGHFTNNNFVDTIIGNSIAIAREAIRNASTYKTGNYRLGFKIYAPTYAATANDGRKFLNDGSFMVKNIDVKLSDNTNIFNLLLNLPFHFKPLYYTEIQGGLRENGLVAGEEHSEIIVKKNGSLNNNFTVYIEHGKYNNTLHEKVEKIEILYPIDIVTNGHQNNYRNLSSLSSITPGVNQLSTILSQIGAIDADQQLYFATHISINVGGKVAVYSSDIIGMNRYNGTPINIDNTFQRGLKVIGMTHSQKYNENIIGQYERDLHLIGELNKPKLQEKIRENVYNFTRNITPKSINDNTINNLINDYGDGIKTGSVIYYGNVDGGQINLGIYDVSSPHNTLKYIGNNTVVIVGGDLYIGNDIIANNKKSDILGIIVLQDNDGKGGNIIIDPKVKEIDAIMYTDKVVLSGTSIHNILAPGAGGTYEALKEQLYIYGTIFSNNTIGGAVKDKTTGNYKCPFFIKNCTLNTSMKYDLNYLRRALDGPRGNYSTIIEYNPLIQNKIPKLFNISN